MASTVKTIDIFLSSGKCISVKDQDDSDLLTYSRRLSELLQNDNITILRTSESAVIVRPSQIQGVLVNEEKQEDGAEVTEVQQEEIEETEDIISD